MKIAIILTLIFNLNLTWSQEKTPACNMNNYQLAADIEYYSFESKKKVIFNDPINFLTIKEKYKALKIEGNIKKAVLIGKDLSLPFEVQNNQATLSISTLNISLYKTLKVHVTDNKGTTCEMVIDITRD